MLSTKKPGTPTELVQRRVQEMKWGSTKPGTPEELVHFGVKGMKWGVRKEYESVAKRTSQAKEKVESGIGRVQVKRSEHREKRAQKHDTTAAKYQKEIDQIQAKKPSHIYFVRQGRKNRVKELEGWRDQEQKDAKDIREGRLTDHQKKVLIGVAAVAVILAAYGTYKVIDSGGARRLLTKDIPLKKNDLLSRKMSHDAIMKEVVKPINPRFGDMGTKMNCRRCTLAYEMRRRGFDVKSTQTVAGTGQTVAGMLNATDPNSNLKTGKWGIIATLFKERIDDPEKGGRLTEALEKGGGLGRELIGDNNFPNMTSNAKVAQVFESLGRNPEGARGELGMRWNMGGAHSMAWEIINGTPVIFDTQTGESYNPDSFRKVALNMNAAGITRLDNIPDLNVDYLRRWITNVK